MCQRARGRATAGDGITKTAAHPPHQGCRRLALPDSRRPWIPYGRVHPANEDGARDAIGTPICCRHAADVREASQKPRRKGGRGRLDGPERSSIDSSRGRRTSRRGWRLYGAGPTRRMPGGSRRADDTTRLDARVAQPYGVGDGAAAAGKRPLFKYEGANHASTTIFGRTLQQAAAMSLAPHVAFIQAAARLTADDPNARRHRTTRQTPPSGTDTHRPHRTTATAAAWSASFLVHFCRSRPMAAARRPLARNLRRRRRVR